MTSKPNETDSQTNIYIELVNRIYGKTKSMLDWPLYTLPQQRMSLTHFPLKVQGPWGHMPILYKMVCKKVQLYKVVWSRHFWQPHPLYKLAGPCPSSIQLFARTSNFFFKSKQSIVWILLGHAWWIGWTFANRLGIQYSAKSFWLGMCLWFIYIYIFKLMCES